MSLFWWLWTVAVLALYLNGIGDILATLLHLVLR